VVVIGGVRGEWIGEGKPSLPRAQAGKEIGSSPKFAKISLPEVLRPAKPEASSRVVFARPSH